MFDWLLVRTTSTLDQARDESLGDATVEEKLLKIKDEGKTSLLLERRRMKAE